MSEPKFEYALTPKELANRTVNFRSELEKLINRHSMENGSNTPDFILADYLTGCLAIFDKTVRDREKFYGNREGMLNR